MLHKPWKGAARLALTLLAGILTGFILLLAVYALPTERMKQNVLASVPALNGEWSKEDSYEQVVPGYITTQLDNTSDAVLMMTAISQSDQPLITRAVDGVTYTSASNGYQTLLSYARDPSSVTPIQVARYWHGYLVYLKPLLLMFSYLDIRMLLMMAQGALLAAVIAGLCRRNLARLIPAFLLSLLCITPVTTGFSLHYSGVMFALLASMIALLHLPKRFLQGWGVLQVFLLTGMLTSYLDCLSYPLASLGVPLVLYPFLFPERTVKAHLKAFLLCVMCWGIGYGGMWAGKWLLAMLFSSDTWFLPNLLAKIAERSSDVGKEVNLNYMDVLVLVFKPFFKRAYLAVAAAAGLTWLWRMLRTRRLPVSDMNAGRTLFLLLTAVLPFAWYFCTKNHSYIHAFFTSRILSIAVFALCSLLTLLIRRHASAKELK